MAALKPELMRILDRKLISPIFQPIARLSDKQIIGYEALIRGPSDSALHSPLVLLDTAERYGQLHILEALCHEAIINSYAQRRFPGKLFVKVNPVSYMQRDYKKDKLSKLIKKYDLSSQVIIELSEHRVTGRHQNMTEAAAHFHDLGFAIAIDHLTPQYSSLHFISKLQPEYIKIDKHYAQELHKDELKFNFLQSIQSLAVAINATIIPVGVETADEFKGIIKIGINHAQGFYFSRPVSHPIVELDEKLFITFPNTITHQKSHSKKITIITKSISPISSEKSVDEVLDLLQHHPNLDILPITEHDKAIGLIMRDKFFSKLFANRYGIELYGKRSIKSFINYMPLSFDKDTTIEQVSQQLTNTMRNDQAFIVTENNHYFGIATILDLLEEITQQQINNAKYANPLTFLPGSVYMNELINDLLLNKAYFCVGYFDLDHFKPYNDAYGYSAGDNIIKAVAETLTTCISADTGYVGHIGGDDFIVILLTEDWLEQCETILQMFSDKVPNYYSEKDLEAGGLYSEDRFGNTRFFPLLSLSVGLVEAHATSQCQSYVDGIRGQKTSQENHWQ